MVFYRLLLSAELSLSLAFALSFYRRFAIALRSVSYRLLFCGELTLKSCGDALSLRTNDANDATD